MNMKTLILPGFSPKNKEWALDTKSYLDKMNEEVEVIAWKHWEQGSTEEGWIEREADKIAGSIDGTSVNIIAKSIGTVVTMVILNSHTELVNKLILCGIPLRDLSNQDRLYYEPLKLFPVHKLLCLQNEADNHGGYSDVSEFVHTLNPAISIKSCDRADHEYPYSEIFTSFLQA
jgi:pimeloyl-ACP methyl ester carboxylesterase